LSSITSAMNSSTPTPALLEQSRRDPASLQVVRDRKGHFGRARIAQPHVVRDRDDALALEADQRATLDPVRVEHRLDDSRVDRGMTVEAPVEALVGQAAEELQESRRILRMRRPQAHGRAVAEHDIGVLGDRDTGRHLRIVAYEERAAQASRARAARAATRSSRAWITRMGTCVPTPR
jgi:hypothetical protein